MTTVEVERMTSRGEGVATLPDGMTVFVPRTVPGDRVSIEVTETRRRWARGRVVSVDRPGNGRATPACDHYLGDRCGGCQLQHAAGDTQLAVKGRNVGDALRRIGKLDVADPPVVASPRPWRYRNKITLNARVDGRLGLHRFDDPAGGFVPNDCLITSERVMALWRLIRDRWDGVPADATAVTVREDRDDALHVVVEASTPWNGAALAAAVGDAAVGYWWKPPRSKVRQVAGPPSDFPALAFEQSNRALARRIRRDAVDALGPVEGSVVHDLYGGVGDTARALADRGATVWSVELDRAASTWARTREPDRPGRRGAVRYLVGAAERRVRDLPEPAAVVLNPPRSGLAAPVTDWLRAWAGGRSSGTVAYVSCDPATLARDIRRVPELGLERVTAYDLFPQTSHVEVLAVLRIPS